MECNVALTDASVFDRIASIFSSTCAFSLGSRGCDSAHAQSPTQKRGPRRGRAVSIRIVWSRAAAERMGTVEVEQPRTGRIFLEIEQEWRIVGASVPVNLCGAGGWAACTMVAAPRGASSLVDRLVLHVAHSVKPTVHSRRPRIRMKEPRVSALCFASK